MPTVSEIEQALFRLAPKELAMDWDNVGHLEGDPAQEVQRVLVALDVTEACCDRGRGNAGCQLIVSHHPLMNVRWHERSCRSLRPDRYLGHLLRRLVKAIFPSYPCIPIWISPPAASTTRWPRRCGSRTLGLCREMRSRLCRMGRLQNAVKLSDFATAVCRALGANGVRYAGSGPVQNVAVGGGACGEYIDTVIAAGCDTFVTSDLTYHQFLDAVPKGINLIDAGHFPTEDPVCAKLVAYSGEGISPADRIKIRFP